MLANLKFHGWVLHIDFWSNKQTNQNEPKVKKMKVEEDMHFHFKFSLPALPPLLLNRPFSKEEEENIFKAGFSSLVLLVYWD